MNHPTASLAVVVRDALNVAGYLTDNGDLSRPAAEKVPQLSRSSVSRHLQTGAFVADELFLIATRLLETTPSDLWARAEKRAA